MVGVAVKALAWLKKVPAWAWIVVVAVGLVIASVVGWRRAAARCAAALERARSAEATLAIEKTAVEEHAEVAAELEVDLAVIDDRAEADVAGLDEKAEAVEDAEDASDGSLADLANEHFSNEK